MNAHGAGPSDPFPSESAHPRTGVSNPSIDTDVAKGFSMQSHAKEDAVLTFLDAAQPFTGDGNIYWTDWSQSIVRRFHALKIPRENWVAIVQFLLYGAAASYALDNGLTEDTTWDVFAATMAAGPWAGAATPLSLHLRQKGSIPMHDTMTQENGLGK
jgi:hypothetical protein